MTILISTFVAVTSFILGKIIAETEKILAEKRRIYSAFLGLLPDPNDAHILSETEMADALKPAIQAKSELMLYAPHPVVFALKALFENYVMAATTLSETSPPLASDYQALAKAQNDLILEMRRDAFQWSVFAYVGKSRLSSEIDART